MGGDITAYFQGEYAANASPSMQGEPFPEEALQSQNDLADLISFDFLANIWFAGAILSAFVHTVTYIRMRKKLLRWSITVNDKNLATQFETCKREYHIERGIALYQCDAVTTPLLVGLFRPCVLLPNIGVTADQARYVFLHELMHFRRRDLWFKLLLVIVRSLHWFNPFVWLAAKKAEEDIELACDADVLNKSVCVTRREYGDTILSFIHPDKAIYLPFATNFFLSHQQLIRRFETIMDTKTKKNGRCCIALFMLAAIFSTMLIGCVNAQASTPDTADIIEVKSEPQDIGDPAKYRARQTEFQEKLLRFYESDNPKLAPGQMVWPVKGHYTLTNIFGRRYDGTDFHTGIDIADANIDRQSVVAAKDGAVVKVNTTYTEGKGYGIYVVLSHADNISTMYAHLNEANVKQGDFVKAGQVIGVVGSTGFAAEPQLHFEVREGAEALDAQSYLLPSTASDK